MDRRSANLLYLVLTFLKKLSVYDENNQRIKKGEFAHKLVRLVPCSCEPIMVMALRLLYNFSFDDVAFTAASGGRFTASHIKFLRLGFAGHQPKTLAQVQGGVELLEVVQPLVQTLGQTYLRM